MNPILAALAAGALLAQDRPPAPPEAARPPEEQFPRWSVHGVFSTDFNALVSDRHARDTMPEEGVAGEYVLGASLHLDRRLTVSARSCFSCHGFELQSAFADYEVLDGVTLRAGRFPLPFGSMSARFLPHQLESTSKPLPYIMGFMPRGREFNQGILPAPAVDNGAGAMANLWLAEGIQLGLEAAVTRGFKGVDTDLDFELSRDFEDNNGEPAGAGRVTLTLGPLVLGASAAGGRYDPDAELAYRLVGADLHLRPFPGWNLRLEGAWRETDFRDPAGDRDASRRRSYAAQIDGEIAPQWRVFLLHDALHVEELFLTSAGPQPVPAPGSSDSENVVTRIAAGAVFAARPGVLLKTSAEFWNFSDFDDTWVFHATLVVSF
jgi:hypothetical protein